MLRNFTIRAFAALLAIIFMAAAPLSALAVDYQGPYNGVKDYLAGKTPSFGSVGGEWLVFALARGGRVSPSGAWCSGYYGSIEAMVRGNGSNTLDPNKATENSRLAIALTSIGRDARNVAGYDLIEPLTDLAFVKRQGVTGVAFALLAMNARSSYGETAAKNACVEYLLGRELNGGGWSLGTTADTDVTAIAVTALAPFSGASSAVSRGIEKLSSMQNADGGFSSMGTPNCESTAQAVIALSSCGVDADTDGRFIKNGHSALEALVSYYKGSGFSHTQNGTVNQMATEQAAEALCAYDRMKTGKKPLYNMNDVSPVSDTTPKPTNTPKPTATPKPSNPPTPTDTPRPTKTPAPTATPTPPAAPTEAQTDAPTVSPTDEASPVPTEAPTETPTEAPTEAPSDEPTQAPATDAPATEAPATEAPATEAPAEITPSPEPSQKPGKGNGWLIPVCAAAALLAAFGAYLLIRRKNYGKTR